MDEPGIRWAVPLSCQICELVNSHGVHFQLRLNAIHTYLRARNGNRPPSVLRLPDKANTSGKQGGLRLGREIRTKKRLTRAFCHFSPRMTLLWKLVSIQQPSHRASLCENAFTRLPGLGPLIWSPRLLQRRRGHRLAGFLFHVGVEKFEA